MTSVAAAPGAARRRLVEQPSHGRPPTAQTALGNDDYFPHALLHRGHVCRRQRVGLLLDPDADRRHQGKYQAALALTRTAETPEPLIVAQPGDSEIRTWLRTQKPDVVISDVDANFDRLAQLGVPMPEKIGYASMVRSGRREISGVETFPEQIAGAAVTRLQQMLYENETGVPELPTCTLLPGRWVEGETVRPAAR